MGAVGRAGDVQGICHKGNRCSGGLHAPLSPTFNCFTDGHLSLLKTKKCTSRGGSVPSKVAGLTRIARLALRRDE